MSSEPAEPSRSSEQGLPREPGVPSGGDPQAGENTCPDCSGSGELDGRACPTCGGRGVVAELVGDA